MILSNEILSLFDVLNKEIRYVMLRGFSSVDEIESGKDIDVYVAKEDRLKLKSKLLSMGWHTPMLNTNEHPHEQFYYVNNKKMYKLDVVYGISFAGGTLHYRFENELIETRIFNEFVYIPDLRHSVLTLILHIIYDKHIMQEHNKERLSTLVDILQSSPEIFDDSEYELIKNVGTVNADEASRQTLQAIKEKYSVLMYMNWVQKVRGNPCRNIARYFVCKFRSILYRIKKADIAIIGVDGSGKSTCIEQMMRVENLKIETQYMGCRDYEESNRSSVVNLLYIYKEMWTKYLKNRFNYGGVVLYDRYPYEIFLNAKGIKRKIYKVVYKVFFPRPKLIYYIYCDAETSLSRKSDIPDENIFRKMKTRFDSYFLTRQNVVCISSDEHSVDEITAYISDKINEMFYEHIV